MEELVKIKYNRRKWEEKHVVEEECYHMVKEGFYDRGWRKIPFRHEGVEIIMSEEIVVEICLEIYHATLPSTENLLEALAPLVS